MRILHVIPTYLPARRYGGPIQSVHQLCVNLAKRRHEIHVFTTNVDGSDDSQVPLETPFVLNGVKVYYFGCKYFRSFYFSPPMKNAFSREVQKYDLVHLHSIYRWPTWAAARMAARAGVPYVLSPRGMLVKELVRKKNRWVKSAWLQFVEKHTIENAAGIHATSELEVREIEKFGFRLPPVFVVPNGFEIESQDSESNGMRAEIEEAIKRKPVLLFLGRINWKKGLDRLVPAMAYVPEANLVIAGNDEENYSPALERLARERNVQDRVTFVGPLYGSKKMALMKAASLFVLPSYSENFGNAVLEAMSAGCPVLVTPEVGLAEMVAASGAGRVVGGDSNQLGEALREMLSSPETLKQMGQRGQKAAASFTWESVATQMESKYLTILNR